MTAPVEPRRGRRPRSRVVALLALIVVVGAIGGIVWSSTRSGEPFARGTRTFTANGITLSYPAGWNVNDLGWPSTGLGSTFAILGTQPWGLCLPTDLNCHYELRLEPSQISVELGDGITGGTTVCKIGLNRSDLAGRGPGDPQATGHLLRVDGRPTLQTDYVVNQADYYHSDAWHSWVVAAPGSVTSVYRIEAKYRGPGDSEFRQQLDDLIASLKFATPSALSDGGPEDCGAPFPAPGAR
jgi:hypothetical protein